MTTAIAEVAELVDAPDSKSGDGDIVWVRVPPSVQLHRFIHDTINFSLIIQFCRSRFTADLSRK